MLRMLDNSHKLKSLMCWWKLEHFLDTFWNIKKFKFSVDQLVICHEMIINLLRSCHLQSLTSFSCLSEKDKSLPEIYHFFWLHIQVAVASNLISHINTFHTRKFENSAFFFFWLKIAHQRFYRSPKFDLRCNKNNLPMWLRMTTRLLSGLGIMFSKKEQKRDAKALDRLGMTLEKAYKYHRELTSTHSAPSLKYSPTFLCLIWRSFALTDSIFWKEKTC